MLAARLVALEKVPSSHGSAADAPGGQFDPGGHGSHAVPLLLGWKLPPSHGLHSALPEALATLPGAHGAGVDAPSAHDDPGGHASHPACAGNGWNLPAAQREHNALSACAKLPASHCAGASDPVGHDEPSGQRGHSAAEVRLVASPYRPAEQSSAADAPSWQ